MKNRRQEQGRQNQGEAFSQAGGGGSVVAPFRTGLFEALHSQFSRRSVESVECRQSSTKKVSFEALERFRTFASNDTARAAFAKASVQGDVAETWYETCDPDPAEEYGPTFAQKIDDTRNFMHRVTDASETVNDAGAFMNKG